MNPLLKSIALAVLVNAVMLTIAAFWFGNFTITTAGFAIAVVLFTLLTVVLKELVLGLVKSFVRALALTMFRGHGVMRLSVLPRSGLSIAVRR